MWLNILSAGIKAGGHIYRKRQETKMAMADAQHRTAMAMAKGEKEYEGKLLEARRICFINFVSADTSISLGSYIRRPNCYGQSKIIF
jgi:uncharacterized protein YqfA (UPF0365 family)